MNLTELKRSKKVSDNTHVLPPSSGKLLTLPAPFNMGEPQPYHGPTGKYPLVPPYEIMAEYANDDTMIKINVTVGINSSLIISNLDIYGGDIMLKPSAHENMQKLFVVYDKQEGEMDEFTPYHLEFEIPAWIEDGKINTLEIYLWNEDPKTSRGTVTTVKHSKLTIDGCQES